MEPTVVEAAARLDVTPRRVRALIEAGRLAARRVGPPSQEHAMDHKTIEADLSLVPADGGTGDPRSLPTFAVACYGELARAGAVDVALSAGSTSLHASFCVPDTGRRGDAHNQALRILSETGERLEGQAWGIVSSSVTVVD